MRLTKTFHKYRQCRIIVLCFKPGIVAVKKFIKFLLGTSMYTDEINLLFQQINMQMGSDIPLKNDNLFGDLISHSIGLAVNCVILAVCQLAGQSFGRLS